MAVSIIDIDNDIIDNRYSIIDIREYNRWPSRYFTNDYYIIFCCTFIMKLELCYIFRRLPARRRTTSTIWMYIYNQGCGKKFGAWRLYVYQSENYLSC